MFNQAGIPMLGIDANDPKIVRAQGAWMEPIKTREAVLAAHPRDHSGCR
jgi:hypothetical protein